MAAFEMLNAVARAAVAPVAAVGRGVVSAIVSAARRIRAIALAVIGATRAAIRLTRAAIRISAPFALSGLLALTVGTALERDSWASAGMARAQVALAQIGAFVQGPGRLGPIGFQSADAAVYAPPLTAIAGVREIPFRRGRVIDEAYRAAFSDCDRTNVFMGVALPARDGCRARPNLLEALVRLPNGALFMEANLHLDLAGSEIACRSPRPGVEPTIERCGALLDFPLAPDVAFESLAANWRRLFVHNDTIPFVTIPLGVAGEGPRPRAFSEETGLEMGDLGVVFYRDKIVPVIIANGGPAHQALAGSLALFEAIGVSRCRAWRERAEEGPAARACDSVRRYGLGATIVLVAFPGSRLTGLTPATIEARVREGAFERLAGMFRRDPFAPR